MRGRILTVSLLLRMGIFASFILSSSSLYAAQKKLSDWLLQQPLSPDSYPLGLSWRVPGEKVTQNELRFDLLNYLSGLDPKIKANPDAMRRLRDWISSLPVTGRVPVAVADARWLQANPSRDPVIRPTDSLVLPIRPKSVTVVTSNGRRCSVRHAPGHEAIDYVKVCSPKSYKKADWVYVAQPNGSVQRFGIALWNREKQNEVAPGAWIWAPPRNEGWPEDFSGKLIAFLATQGPAPDPGKPDQKIDSLPAPGGESRPWSPDQEMPALVPGPILAAPSEMPAHSGSTVITANDWGEAGLLQTPTARMRNAGDFSFTLSHVYPYTHGNVFVQPLDWLEVGFRYTDISNRLYGPVSLSGNQSYKDKSLDAKGSLLRESAYVPELAVGIRDIAGTGLFSGEYVVSSKRTGPLDWSLGLGWGYMAGRADLGNPLGLISPGFNTRKTALVGQGGNFAFGTYFRGPTAMFGGVQYQTPWDPLLLKLEYEGNNYQHEPFDNNLPKSSPWNFGAVYQISPSVDLSAGLERGNTAMFSITLHSRLDRLSMPKLSDPAPVPILPIFPVAAPDWGKTSRDIMQQTGWHVRSIKQHGSELRIAVDDPNVPYWRNRLDRAVAVLHRDAPASITRYTFIYFEQGMKVAEHKVNRYVWVKQKTQPVPPSEQRKAVVALAPEKTVSPVQQLPLYSDPLPAFESSLGMNFNYFLGGPNGFLLYQIAPIERAKLRLNRNTWIDGDVQLDVLDNFNKFTYDAPSNLPRVRTYLREYMTTSKVTMPNLQITHVDKLGDNQYYSLYGGYLEQMFGGVGAEWLYRPFASSVAVGVDVNEVKQRDFAQDFGFRNYSVLTGHATVYWDTGWNNIRANLSAGRYLAGDVGVTVQMSRVFDNGVSVGAYFTKTNVSAQQFGEGSSDKGLFISIPFDALLTKSSNTYGNFLWEPLLRDGGAKLARAVTLYGLTQPRDDRTLRYDPAPLPNDALMPADKRELWNPPKLPVPELQTTPAPTASQWRSDQPDFKENLTAALYQESFRNIKIDFDSSYRLSVSLSNERIRPDSSAIGRAVRTIMLSEPLETREIKIIFAEHIDPAVTYDFFELKRLKRYFNGEITQAQLMNFVDIEYINPTVRESDPLAGLNDINAGTQEPGLGEMLRSDMRPVARVERDTINAAHIAADTDWFKTGLIGTGVILCSSLLDKPAENFAKKHAASTWLKLGDNIGNSIPIMASGATAFAALLISDPELSQTAYSASEAAVSSFVTVLGLKYAVGRARPWTGQGNHSFHPFAGSAAAGTDGFPSGHSIIAWSIATPFAEEYDAPWLYGVASITNLARVGSQKHWVSDTVAGSFLGYELGKLFWESSQLSKKDGPHVLLGLTGINLSWDLP